MVVKEHVLKLSIFYLERLCTRDFFDQALSQNLKELDIINRINLNVIDLTNKSKVEDLIKEHKPSYFVHLGSQSSVKKSFEFKKLTEESNMIITENIVIQEGADSQEILGS